MPEKFAIAFIAAFFSFLFFVFLEFIKTARDKKERNVRALRAILSELLTNTLLNDKNIHKLTWEALSPVKFRFEIWQNCCGEILIPEKDRESLEIVYSGIHLDNQLADLVNKMGAKPNQTDLSEAHKRRQKELNAAIKNINKNLTEMEEVSILLLFLKEIFGSSHRIVSMFQDFPKKTNAQKN